MGVPHLLPHTIKTILSYEEQAWYRLLLKNDLSGCTLSGSEEYSVITDAKQTASEMGLRITAQYGRLSPQSLAGQLGLTIMFSTGELQEPYFYLGLYEPDSRTITVNDSAVSLVRQFIASHELEEYTPPDDIVAVVLFHEIFHALEETYPGIYTRSRMLKRKVLGLWPFCRGLAGASEVAAVHFSKWMTGISYSPCIFERYLVLALDS